jgi:translation initiation factor IF-2
MFDHTGWNFSEAKLSDVAQITGWRDLPIVGSKVYQVESEKKAHMVMKYCQTNINKKKSVDQKKVADEKHAKHVVVSKVFGHRPVSHCFLIIKEFLFQEYKKVMEMRLSGLATKPKPLEKQKEDDSLKFNVIIKGDVVGSVEAILDALGTYNDEKCALSIVNYGVGTVTQNDLELSKTFNGNNRSGACKLISFYYDHNRWGFINNFSRNILLQH